MTPYEYVTKNKGRIKDRLKIRLYSLEVAAEEVIAKMVALKLFLDSGIIVDSKYIFSKGNRVLSPAIYKRIELLKVYFETMLKDCLTIIDRPMTPSQIRADVERHAIANGKYKENELGDNIYYPNDPHLTTIIITDTVGNLKVETHNGQTSVKTTIDLHSANCRDIYRNQLNFACVNVSHSNRSMDDVNRAKHGEIFPKLADIKETNMLAQDANLVLTLFDPVNHMTPNNGLSSFMGYDILKLKNRFRAVGILKNREGENNKRVALVFVGECGYFRELPRSNIISTTDYAAITGLSHFEDLPVEKQLLYTKEKD